MTVQQEQPSQQAMNERSVCRYIWTGNTDQAKARTPQACQHVRASKPYFIGTPVLDPPFAFPDVRGASDLAK